MEKVTFQNPEGLNLVGNLHIPEVDTKSLILMIHGFTSNKDRPRFVKAAEVFSKNCFAALRFDCSGCGESDDSEITIERQLSDVKAALDFVKNKGYENIGLLGESLGGLYSLMAYCPNIKTMVLWAPVTISKKPGFCKDPEKMKELKEKGFILKYKDEKYFRLGKQYLEERQSINQKTLVSPVRCPVLMLLGTEDNTIVKSDLEKAVHYLSPESELVMIEGENHQFRNKTDKDISLSLDWFRKYLE